MIFSSNRKIRHRISLLQIASVCHLVNPTACRDSIGRSMHKNCNQNRYNFSANRKILYWTSLLQIASVCYLVNPTACRDSYEPSDVHKLQLEPIWFFIKSKNTTSDQLAPNCIRLSFSEPYSLWRQKNKGGTKILSKIWQKNKGGSFEKFSKTADFDQN